MWIEITDLAVCEKEEMRSTKCADQAQYFEDADLTETHHDPNVSSEAWGAIDSHTNLIQSKLFAIKHILIGKQGENSRVDYSRVNKSSWNKSHEEFLEVEALTINSYAVKRRNIL